MLIYLINEILCDLWTWLSLSNSGPLLMAQNYPFFPNLITNVFYKMLSSFHFSLGVLFVSWTVGYIDFYPLWIKLDLKIKCHFSKITVLWVGVGSQRKSSSAQLDFLFIIFSIHGCGSLGAVNTETHQAIFLTTEMQYSNF